MDLDLETTIHAVLFVVAFGAMAVSFLKDTL